MISEFTIGADVCKGIGVCEAAARVMGIGLFVGKSTGKIGSDVCKEVGVSKTVVRTSGDGLLVGRSATKSVGGIMGERGFASKAVGVVIGFAISTKAKGCEWVGVALLFKLSAIAEVAAHAAIPTTAKIRANANAS
jgi:hypothetical protein